jgi:hypothetical protein
MVEAVLKDISKSTRELGNSQRQFRQAANENNRSIGKFAKDISSMFDSQRRSSNSLNNAINDSISESQQTASKIDTTNSLLQESVSLLSSMVGELKNLRVGIRNLAVSLSQSGGGLSGSGGGAAPTPTGAAGALGSASTGMLGKISAGSVGIATALVGGGLALGESRQFNQSAEYAARGGGNIRAAGESGSASEAMQFFQSKGWSKDQAAGIVGNLQAESGASLRTNAVGDGGRAYGIAQWHPDRQANFKKVYGKDIRESSFKEQLEFIQWELNNTEKKAGQILRSARSAAEAAALFDKHYERSSGAHRQKRIVNAEALAGSKQQSQTMSAPAAASQAPTAQAITPGSSSGNSGAAIAGAAGAVTGATSSGGGATSADTNQQASSPPSSSSERSGTGQGRDAQAIGGVQSGIADKLKQIESAFGTRLNVTSGYRDPQRNKNAGGAGDSAHLRGNAVDISFNGGVAETLKLIEIASKAGIGGIGVYGPGSVHLDTESKRAWGGNYRRESVPQWAEGAIRAHETNKWGEYDSSARGGEQATRAGGGGMIGGAMMGMMGGGMYQMGVPGALGGMIGGGLGSMISSMMGSRESNKAPFDFKQFSELSESEQTSARFFEADRNLRNQQQRIQQTAAEEEAKKQQMQQRLAEAPPPPRRPAESSTDQLVSLTPSPNVAKDVNERIENWARDLRLAFSGGTGWELL